MYSIYKRSNMYNKSIVIIIIIGLVIASFGCPAYSQAPPDPSSVERATRESDRQIREEVEEKLRVPPKEPPKIEEEEELPAHDILPTHPE